MLGAGFPTVCSPSCHFHVVASTLSLSGTYRDFNLETVLNMGDMFYLQIFKIVIFSCLLSFGKRPKVPKPTSMVYNIVLTGELFGSIRDKNHSLLTKYLPTRSLDKCTESVVMGSFRKVIGN